MGTARSRRPRMRGSGTQPLGLSLLAGVGDRACCLPPGTKPPRGRPVDGHGQEPPRPRMRGSGIQPPGLSPPAGANRAVRIAIEHLFSGIVAIVENTPRRHVRRRKGPASAPRDQAPERSPRGSAGRWARSGAAAPNLTGRMHQSAEGSTICRGRLLGVSAGKGPWTKAAWRWSPPPAARDEAPGGRPADGHGQETPRQN